MRKKLIELLARYFTIGDSYAYNLTRVKEAFAVGTVSLEDFVEFDDDVVADIADFLIANGVTIPVRCKDCKHWLKDSPGCTDAIGRCEWANYMVCANGYCVYGERKTDDETTGRNHPGIR